MSSVGTAPNEDSRYAQWQGLRAWRVYTVMCLSTLALSGCLLHAPKHTPVPTASSVVDWQTWSAQGRIGLQGVEQSGSARFQWDQQPGRSSVTLRGPLGIGGMSLVLDTQLHLTSGDGRRYDADRALAELEAQTGVAMPLQQLRNWLRGVPAPGAFEWLAGLPEGVAVLLQDGWRIEYNEWMSVGIYTLPRKMLASQGQVRVKVLVETWAGP